ncbi:4,5-DOPA dioxygenase extradiol [Photorhabdus luminescens]|uniref:4,5-DOPA dioxygenase extradiol n=1 Tax=Photorhabdus akhurstii TaxID=171438 RepID=A0ABX8LXD7_9GAMM|nr:4,5-DOPA dioxygenase extradiol [Photorhabdus akhurstii]PQQ33643.1 4,5-DOPA dioxygenase extradiol [Photorhabdus luminescens]QXF35174.1 4,5-DOPA dioxygenase extradiol [Photorhabdus akhurstii]UJD77006.1 4,5-DOPA dioxygenase extradiol [Photorhabdus luminescens]
MNISRMPALFIGHGSPMNVLGENRYTNVWRELGERLPVPRAILAISAHWYTNGTAVTAMSQPKTIHDFRGFPQELYETQYPAKGSPELAVLVQEMLEPVEVYADHHQWGLDHGTWGILVKMYPQANIPVIQLSIDNAKPATYHYELGKKLAALRDEGVLILGSGNVVHNLRTMKRQEPNAEPYPWAESFNHYVRDNLTSNEQPYPLIHALDREEGQLSNPSPEHFLPLLYIMGTWDRKEAVSIPVDGLESGSLSMLSVQVG